MTLEEKIGQMLIFGFNGKALDEQAKETIIKYKVGGIIVLGGNVENAPQLLNLVNSIKNTGGTDSIPLFICVDEEGGRVSRMPPEIEKLPPALIVGNTGSGELSHETGRVIAKEIKAFGFNMDFAPVLDIYSNKANTVIGNRSFGHTADRVESLGIPNMEGIRSEGVIPVVKHFPGHGDTSVDSHKDLPVVNHDLERLKSFELIPFAGAIKRNADAMMVAHILLSEIDPENPASLSKKIVSDLLREQMGFGGVIITDDLTMGAITKNYSIADAAVKAVNAGCDIVMVVQGQENEIAAAEALIKAAGDGSIPVERVDESVYRILKLKAEYGLANTPVESFDIDGINNKIREVVAKM